MCNSPPPADPSIPTTAQFYSIPAFLTATTSRTLPRFLERLSLRERIRYVPSTSFLTSPCLQLLALRNFTLPIGQSGWNESEVDVAFGTSRDDLVAAAPAGRKNNSVGVV
ncbi:hypothetical protein HDU93_005326, partial [Gonapodya sp. JEL0774]